MSPLMITCSMNAQSRSAMLAEHAAARLRQRGVEADRLDLREYELPLCDGEQAYADPRVEAITRRIERADAIVLAVPIYNYGVNAAAKNLIELTGRAWGDKLVGLLAAAGGPGSYMSLMPLMNSLMLDFHCLILPRFVLSTPQTMNDDGQLDEQLAARIEQFCQHLYHLGTTLHNAARR